jgi:heme-degrading monooxygenase HmoA
MGLRQGKLWRRTVTKVCHGLRIWARIWQPKFHREHKMATPARALWGFVTVWEFRPKPGAERRFEEAYGPQGVWANFFAPGEGFVAMELNRDLKDPRRYLTLDFWTSKAAYDRFRETHAEQYRTIDAQCEDLTAEEKLIGYFERRL